MKVAVRERQALLDAVGLAGTAPSLHNSQPWRWRLGVDGLDLRLEPDRLLPIADPQARLAILSCGAALHHARISLAATGWQVTISRSNEPERLAGLRIVGRTSADPVAVRLLEAADRRHTDRRTVPGAPLDTHRLRPIEDAVTAEAVQLHVLRSDQVYLLARTTDLAHTAEARESAWRVELAGLVGGDRAAGRGIPDAAIPRQVAWLRAPERHFGRDGFTLINESHHQAATFAILHGSGDSRLDWLRAGEALSAGWLTATEFDVALLPLSAMIEVPATREAVSRLLPGRDRPYLVLRLSTLGPYAGSRLPSPRLPLRDVLDSDPPD